MHLKSILVVPAVTLSPIAVTAIAEQFVP